MVYGVYVVRMTFVVRMWCVYGAYVVRMWYFTYSLGLLPSVTAISSY